ncbi:MULTISPECIES: phosphate/phosphite/phosphonate ABC transporter substrate-binding protein [Nostocales]|uniref:PhnD/SsuA/transferrin family substrate-binding protein n=3 Tax=Nostocales TaxID=1161 RepID=A0A0C1NJR8_9CYAN|nr:PhnD/SsuA/transferrin family substrate-binding protein [Tolypothrix bouteillei]KAF3888005.1 PhnD/SsuA/transferrin family substrate-binding protein [Tolypothrix bouteillei VB521301]
MHRRQLIYNIFLFIASCTTTKNYNSSSKDSTVTLPKTLRFTVTDDKTLEEIERSFGSFKIALEQVLETKIEFVAVKNYIAAATALQSDRVDLILIGPSEYVIIRARTQAIPLTAITRPNYHSLILVSRKSGIKSLAQLKGKKIALGDLGAAGSYLSPLKMLIDAGLNPKSDVEIVNLEETERFLTLKKGEVYASAFSNNTYEREVVEKKAESEFLIVAQSPPLPNDVFILNSKFDRAIVEHIKSRMIENQDKLIQALILGRKNKKYKKSQLVSVNDSDYNMIREVYRAIGQDMFF